MCLSKLKYSIKLGLTKTELETVRLIVSYDNTGLISFKKFGIVVLHRCSSNILLNKIKEIVLDIPMFYIKNLTMHTCMLVQ